jgi:hypothetical protein
VRSLALAPRTRHLQRAMGGSSDSGRDGSGNVNGITPHVLPSLTIAVPVFGQSYCGWVLPVSISSEQDLRLDQCGPSTMWKSFHQ